MEGREHVLSWSTPATCICLHQRKCVELRTPPSLSTHSPCLHPSLFSQHRLLLRGSFACLHTSPWQHNPDKKAKAVVEKAVDSLKEKKDATVEAVDNLKVVLPSLPPNLSPYVSPLVLHVLSSLFVSPSTAPPFIVPSLQLWTRGHLSLPACGMWCCITTMAFVCWRLTSEWHSGSS